MRPPDAAPSRSRHAAPLLLVVLLALLGGWRLLGGRLLMGHDTLAYPARIVEHHENLRRGVLVPRWAPDLAGGHGLPLFVLAPQLFVLAADLIHSLGAPLIRSHNLALLAFYLGGGLAMYGATSRLAGRSGGVLAAAAWLFAPYVHLTLYVRGAAGEVSGLPALPLALWGAERLAAASHRSGITLLALAVALAGMAHGGVLFITLLLVPLLAAAAAIAARHPRPLGQAAGAVALGLLVAAHVFAVALLESDNLGTARLVRGYGDHVHHFLHPSQLLSVKWAYGFSQMGKDDGMGFGLGPVHGLLGAAGLVQAWRSREPRTRALALVLAALSALGILLTLAPSDPVWRTVPTMRLLSFPWRFLVLPALGGSALAAFAARQRPALAALGIALLVALNLGHTRPEGYLPYTDADFTPRRIAETNLQVGWAAEFNPRWMEKAPSFTPTAATLDGQARETLRLPTERQYDIDARSAGTVSLHLTYYPGWEVTVDGAPVAIRPDSPHGRIALDLAPARHQVVARFRRTPARLWLDLASAAGALLLALAGVGSVRARDGAVDAGREGRQTRPT